MEKNILDFGEKCFINNLFHKYKKPISIDKVDTKKIVLSSTESYGNKDPFKFFIGYISNVSIVPLYIKIPQMNACAKYFYRNNKQIYESLVRDKEIFKKYNAILDKISNLFKKIIWWWISV